MGILFAQPVALGVDDALDPDRLGQQRRHHSQEFHRAIEIALRLESKIDAQRAHRLSVQQNRHADVTELVGGQFRALGGAAEEHRLAGDTGHHDGLAALHHPPGDAFAEPELHVRLAGGGAFGRDHFDLPFRLAQQRDRTAHGAMVALEDAEHLVHRAFLVGGGRQRLADLEERR
jgi:hypothetical protein